MKTIEIDCVEVSCPDGGGHSEVHVAYFSDEVVANEFIKRQATRTNWPMYARPVRKTYVICETVAEMETATQEKKKKAALEKLTAEERALLGL